MYPYHPPSLPVILIQSCFDTSHFDTSLFSLLLNCFTYLEWRIFTQNIFLFTCKQYLKRSKFLCNFTAWVWIKTTGYPRPFPQSCLGEDAVEPQYNKCQGTGKICSLLRGCVILRYFSIYFTITRVKKIVCYTKDFVCYINVPLY